MNYSVMAMLIMELVIKDLNVQMVLMKILIFAVKVIIKHMILLFVAKFFVHQVNFNVKMVNVLTFKIIAMEIFNMELGIKNQIAQMVLMSYLIIVAQMKIIFILRKHADNNVIYLIMISVCLIMVGLKNLLIAKMARTFIMFVIMKEKRIIFGNLKNVVHVPVILTVTIPYGTYQMNYYVMEMLIMELETKDLIVQVVLTKLLIFVVKVIIKHTILWFVVKFFVLKVNYNVKMENVLIFKIIAMEIFKKKLGINSLIALMALMSY